MINHWKRQGRLWVGFDRNDLSVFGRESTFMARVLRLLRRSVAPAPGRRVPGGYYPSGTPFGIIIVGRLWDEERMLRIAYAYEQRTHARRTPKLVLHPAELNRPESGK
jgi:hypothetical protein